VLKNGPPGRETREFTVSQRLMFKISFILLSKC
jgi:hypothetical protein